MPTVWPANRLLYECLRAAILDGSMPARTRLPPSRDLAAELGMSRNTILFAYEQLQAEGYVQARTGSGTFVGDVLAHTLPASRTRPAVPPREERRGIAAPEPRVSRRGAELARGALASPLQWGAFVPGVPDVTAFAHGRFAQLMAQCTRRAAPALHSYASAGGHPALQRSLAQYLRQARSVNCEPSQVLITEGIHQAVDLAARLLADPGDAAWVEEPGYWGTRSILRMNGLDVRPVDVDGEGLKLPSGDAPRLAFVTPSHQYPLGSIMSLPRRLALLEAAGEQGFWVVEDDYDSEFRFAGQPIASLQGLVPDAPVIYIGTFSKTLYPGLRVAYMVLPASLSDLFVSAQMELHRGGHLVTQAALAELIDSGHYAAHIRRMRLLYAARRAHLIGLVHESLGPGWIHPFDSNAGLHLVLQLPTGLSDVEVARAAQALGVTVRPLSRYYAGVARTQGLLVGFASVPEPEMDSAWRRLVQCLEAAGGLPGKVRGRT